MVPYSYETLRLRSPLWYLTLPQYFRRFKNGSETILPAQFLILRQLPAQR